MDHSIALPDAAHRHSVESQSFLPQQVVVEHVKHQHCLIVVLQDDDVSFIEQGLYLTIFNDLRLEGRVCLLVCRGPLNDYLNKRIELFLGLCIFSWLSYL